MATSSARKSLMEVPRTTEAKVLAFGYHPSRAERYAKGEQLRTNCPRGSHAVWKPSTNRVNPLSLIKEADKGRLPDLVPIRQGRNAEVALLRFIEARR